MPSCLISVGSNLGEPAAQVTSCLDLLQQHRLMQVSAVSKFRKTKPVGGPPDQEEFLNAAVRVETGLSAPEVLRELQQIENQLGRVRDVRWGARVIDLDLLLYDDLVLQTEELELPHPRMAFRRFVIEPAGQIAGDMVHPRIGWTISQLVAHLDSTPDYVALTGIPGVGKTAVVQAVADRIPVHKLIGPTPKPRTIGRPAEKLVAVEEEVFETRKKMLEAVPAVEPRDATDHKPRSFTLSDFWFEQSAAYIECLLAGELQADLLRRFDEILAGIPQPKLLVVLEQSPFRDSGKEGDDDRLEVLQQRIIQRSRIPGRGPTLWLDAADLPRAVDEIVAALEAMQ